LPKGSHGKETGVDGDKANNDLRFWERLAPNYDRHVKWLGKSQTRVIELLRDQVANSHRVLDVGAGNGNIALAVAEVVPFVDAVDSSFLDA
jgi:ubiquinone/menaquinone biosynthesis C-methylase UbiE